MKKMLLAAIMLTATTVFAAMNLWKNDKAHSANLYRRPSGYQ